MINLIDLGVANAGDGDNLRAGGQKINDNFAHLNGRLHAAAADPTANDDAGDDHQVGSLWINTSTGATFQCRSAASSAAVWIGLAATQTPGFRTGQWWSPYRCNAGQGQALGGGTIRMTPFMTPRRVSVSDVGAGIHSTNGSVSYQLAIYAGDPATGRPVGAPLTSTGSISGGSQNGSASLASPITLEPGRLYFFAAQSNGNLSFVSHGNSLEAQFLIGITNLAFLANGAFSVGFHLSYGSGLAFGTWPDLTSQTLAEVNGNGPPLPLLKIANAAP